MREIAQTNLQLYNQLIEAGWSNDDLQRTRAAHDLAAELFSGRHRCSGKPFIAHLVGTASVIATSDGGPEMVSAALLHAAYDTGDFGGGARRRDRRAVVSRVIGAQSERLVDLYAKTQWTVDVLERAVRERAQHLAADPRDVLLLRIANEVDEHVDRGTRYCDKRGHALYGEAAVTQMLALAEVLERPRLADECRRILIAEQASVAIPSVLRSDGMGSELVAPRSYSLRVSIALRRELRRVVATIPGARSVVTMARRRQ